MACALLCMLCQDPWKFVGGVMMAGVVYHRAPRMMADGASNIWTILRYGPRYLWWRVWRR